MPSERSLKLARGIVLCTCGDDRLKIKGDYHFANCPIRDGVDLDVAALLDRELQAQHERTLASVLPELLEGVRVCFNEPMIDDENNPQKYRILKLVRRIARRRFANSPRPTGDTK